MSEDNSNSLTAEQKLAIQEYLLLALNKWLRLFGFASIGGVLIAIAIGLIYVFFILPGQAVETAKLRILQDIDILVADLSRTLTDRLEETGENKERLAALQRDTEKAKLRVEEIQEALSDVNESTLAASSNFIAELKDAEQLSDLINRIGVIEKRKLCYCLDARHNERSCSQIGGWTEFKGDGKTPDRIRIYYCD